MKKLYSLSFLLLSLCWLPANAQKTQSTDLQMRSAFEVPSIARTKAINADLKARTEKRIAESQELMKVQAAQVQQLKTLMQERTLLQKKLDELKLKNIEAIKKTGQDQYSRQIASLEKQFLSNLKHANSIRITPVYNGTISKPEPSINKFQKGSAVVQKLDSILILNGNYGELNKETYTYDAAGNPVNYFRYSYDSLAGAWQKTNKSVLSYDLDGNNTDYVSSFWNVDSMDWVYTERGHTDYDPVSGRPTMEVREYWNSSISSWVPSSKNEYDYDPSGNQTLFATYYWNIDSSEWDGYNKYVNAYDEERRPILNEYYYWDNTFDEWYGYSKTVNLFDASGHSLLNESYMWEYGLKTWVGTSRYTYAYDANDNQTLYNAYSWDYGLMNWRPEYRYEYAYDTYDNKILDVYSSWNIDSLALIYSNKSEYSYDANGNLLLQASYYRSNGMWVGNSYWEKTYNADDLELNYLVKTWDWGNNNWMDYYKYNYDYNAAGLKILDEYYTWDYLGGKWDGQYKTVFGFDDFGADTLKVEFNWNYGSLMWDTTFITRPVAYDGFGRPTTLDRFQYYGAGSYNLQSETQITYDAAGRRIFEDMSDFDGESWNQLKTIETAYDSKGNDTLRIISQFDYYYYQLLPYSKEEYAYDSQNREIFNSYYYWNQNLSRWDGESKSEKAYDAYGNEILNTSWWWDGEMGDWIGSSKTLRKYDAKGYELSYEEYSWDYSNYEWYGYNKYENTYDAFGHNILYAYYQWDPINKTWIGYYKYEYAFAGEFGRTLEIRYSWNIDLQQWIGDYKNIWAFDSEGTLILSSSAIWDYEMNVFVDNQRNDFFYDYNYDIKNLKQPSYIYSQYYDMMGHEGKGSQQEPYWDMIKHRLIERRDSYWAGTSWDVFNSVKFFYSGLGVETGNVAGFVLLPDETPLDAGEVIMYPAQVTAGGSEATLSARIMKDGSFSFIGIPTGEYIIAVFPDTSLYPDALVSYYGDVALWSDASMLVLADGTSLTDIVIHAIVPPALNGSAILSGMVETADVKSGTIQKSGNAVKGSPVKSAGVILVGRSKAGTILARTKTDEFGNYKFNNVPPGNYDILVDIPGLTLVTYHTVTVEISDTEITDLNYIVGTTDITNEIDDLKLQRFQVYPNPGRDYVNLAVPEEENGPVLVKILDMSGNLKQVEFCPAGVNRISLALPSGVYLMQIQSTDGPVYRKIMLQ